MGPGSCKFKEIFRAKAVVDSPHSSSRSLLLTAAYPCKNKLTVVGIGSGSSPASDLEAIFPAVAAVISSGPRPIQASHARSSQLMVNSSSSQIVDIRFPNHFNINVVTSTLHQAIKGMALMVGIGSGSHRQESDY
jgi:hypothetical protein